MFQVTAWKTLVAWASGLIATVYVCLRVASIRNAGLTATTLVSLPALADANEVRTFAVTVDGKPAGTYRVTTAVAADGTETVAAVAEVKVKTTLLTYIYELQSTEVWRNGQLVSVEARSNDDGKKHAVSAKVEAGGLMVTVNKETRKIPTAVLTATGVRVPCGAEGRDAVLFDTEDGSDTAVRAEPCGACRVTLNGKAIDGSKFKLTGKGVASEWWFDASGRPIHQVNSWDGHKVVFELTGVTR